MAALLRRHTCCGCIPVHTGVTIITIFGILNKLSGFYGLISFDFSDPAALTVYIYSLIGVFVFSRGLWALQHENVRLIQWYVIFYWFDCLVSTLTTVLFAVKWFAFTDHSLPELASDPSKQFEHDQDFRMECLVSITLLVALRLVHIYFGVVLSLYSRSLGKAYYSKLAAAAINQDLEDTYTDVRRL